MTKHSTDDYCKYCKYRMDRAWDTIKEVQSHIEQGFWNTAINRMYYACFYAIGALLLKHGTEVSSHPGVRQKFGEQFVKTGIIDKSLAKHFAELFDKRQKGDYNDFFDYEEETVRMLYPKSQELIKRIDDLINQ